MTREQALKAIIQAAGPERLVLVDDQNAWPAVCSAIEAGGNRRLLLFVGAVGDSGRGRPDERRMQNPAINGAIYQRPGHETLVLGINLEHGSPVLVSWESGRRVGRDTRYSLFVPTALLVEAATTGWAKHTTASGESVIAFAGSRFSELVSSFREQQPIARAPTVPEDSIMLEPEHTNDESDHDDSELQSIAEAMSALSEGDFPKDISQAPDVFTAADVDWQSNGWIGALGSIAGWLCLDDEVDFRRSPTEVLNDLFASLGAKDPSTCFAVIEGAARLLAPGVAALDSRLEQAVSLKNKFQEDIDDGVGRGAASTTWRDAWEEQADGADTEPVQVVAKVTSWPIQSFVQHAKENELVLDPSYQRGVVWSTKDSRKLIESVLRGIPLPSVILNQDGDKYEIVDGKQRLTAILRFVGVHPVAIDFAQRRSDEAGIPFSLYSEDYPKWRAGIRRNSGLSSKEEREHYLPFKFLLGAYNLGDPLRTVHGKYYSQILNHPVKIQGKDEPVRKLFASTSEYSIPIIKYEATDVQQIHRVFSLYNKQGKHLNTTELRNAVYHHLALTKLLLTLSGDNKDVQSLAPYVAHLAIDAISNLLKALNVADARFNHTKLISWVAALLCRRPDSKDGKQKTPSTSAFIGSMFERVSRDQQHVMRSESVCAKVASHLVGGAQLFAALREVEGVGPEFTHGKSPGEKWEELPVVAMWTACTLASFAEVTADQMLGAASKIRSFTTGRPPLGKQQSKTQWGYLSQAILGLVDTIGIDRSRLGNSLLKTLGSNCIETLTAAPALPAGA